MCVRERTGGVVVVVVGMVRQRLGWYINTFEGREGQRRIETKRDNLLICRSLGQLVMHGFEMPLNNVAVYGGTKVRVVQKGV